MSSHHRAEPSSLLGDGEMQAALIWSLTSASLARIRLEMVFRLSQKPPLLFFPHMCVKPKNRQSQVSRRPGPHDPGRRCARTR